MKAATGAAGQAASPGDTGGRTAPVSRRQTMRAIVQAGYGSADVLHLEEIGQPAAAAARSSSGSMPPGSTGAPGT